MSLTDSMLDDDLVEIIADYPQSFTFSGASYACAADDLTEGRRPVEAGIFPEDAINLHVRTAILPATRPVAGDQVIYSGRTLRIVSVITRVDDQLVTLTCEEVTA